MNFILKKRLKSLLYPLRKGIARFILDETDTIFYKSGSLIASDKIKGDYLEFGVYSGASFSSAFNTVKNAFESLWNPSEWNTEKDCLERRKIWAEMRFFAFDSFQGLPKPTGIDSLSNDFTEGKYSNSEDNFKNYIASMGVPLDRVKIISGWFNEILNDKTIKKYDLKHASIIHIDSDLYESAKAVLNFIKPLLVDGTVIIFDDWYHFKGNPDLGEQKAFKDWLDANPEWIATQYQKEGPWRNSFILNPAVVQKLR